MFPSLAGHPVVVSGALDTVMAGLACGEVSPAAWEIVSAAADAFVAIDDGYAFAGLYGDVVVMEKIGATRGGESQESP